jgi:glycosyltransferase involved in cell wall biosynthesis
MPRVSVLVPTYRYSEYLDQAISSILAQDFEDFELIISDDASGDGSAEKIRAFAERDRRIRAYVQPKNLGMVPHWNWCLAQAKGDYIKYLFGDDYLATRQALGQLVRALDAQPSAVLATGQRQWVDEKGQTMFRAESMPSNGLTNGTEATANCMSVDRNLIGEPPAVLFRKAAGLRGFDVTFRQLVDLEMWYCLLESGDLMTVPDLVLSFRVHNAQQTAQNARSRIASVETMRMVARYHEAFRHAFKGRSEAQYQRALSQIIYYARKQRPQPAEAKEAELSLMNRVGTGTYQRNLLLHRLTKPITNLRRKFRKSA